MPSPKLLILGSIFSAPQPPLSISEVTIVGASFYLVELLTVALMAAYIRQIGEFAATPAAFHKAFTLAAIAPTPLWLSSLALFIPNLSVNALIVGIAWIGSAALIRHGVGPLFQVHDDAKAHRMANLIIVMGVCAWIALMVVLELMLSLVVGWR